MTTTPQPAWLTRARAGEEGRFAQPIAEAYDISDSVNRRKLESLYPFLRDNERLGCGETAGQREADMARLTMPWN